MRSMLALCRQLALQLARHVDRRLPAGAVLSLSLSLSLSCVGIAHAQQPPTKPRGVVTEERLALVIGNAAYKNDPLDNPVNDARLISASLQKSGFNVTLRENLDRVGLLNALRDFAAKLNENTIAVLYYAGHGLQLRDHNYLIPVDAEMRSEDEIPITGMDLNFILGRMSAARSRINIVILDACRNNPFAGKTVSAPPGLAPVDAPVGTLLAFATAPGKLAADSGTGSSSNSLYARYLAKYLLVPGLPIESVFKRVREGVVNDTQKQQVPWESSSLQGEFAFVPGVTSSRESEPGQDAAGELAFWNSIQASNRAEEYRAYLRQYPSGRFASLAQMRLAVFTSSATPPTSTTPTAAAAPSNVSPSASGSATAASSPPTVVVIASPDSRPQQQPHSDTLPHAGDTWRYRVQDQFRLGDLFLTARVDGVTPDGVAETWTTTSDAKLRTTLVPLQPGFSTLPGWNLTPPEFSPYLLASGGLRPGAQIADQPRRIDEAIVPLRSNVAAEEEVTVAAGKFRAIKLILKGQSNSRGAGRSTAVSTEHVIWYSPQVKRTVKYTVSTSVGGTLRESTTFELVEFKLN
jgi:hypothetical protein